MRGSLQWWRSSHSAIAVPAFAATAPRHVTETTVGGEKFVPNRLVADTMHFKLGTVRIKSGGTLTFVDKTKNAHTFSIVKKGQVPRTAKRWTTASDRARATRSR